MTTAATKPVTVEYVTYDGTNLDEVTTFAGGISAAIGPGNVPQIMTSDGRYADLHPGWVKRPLRPDPWGSPQGGTAVSRAGAVH
jgi:hypothetical protein